MEDKPSNEQTSGGEIESELEKDDTASSSSQNLAVGKCIPGFLIPLVEALILHRKARENRTSDVTLLIALYLKKGVWVKASTCVRNSQKLVKKSVEKYKYPLPWGSKLALEAVRYKADSEWVRATLDDMNSVVKEGFRTKEGGELEGALKEHKKGAGRRKSSSSLDSNRSGGKSTGSGTKCLQRRSSRISVLKQWSADSTGEISPQTKKSRWQKKKKQTVHKSIWGNSPRSRRAARWAIKSSSSESQISTLRDSGDDEVRDSEKEDDGIIYCPFTNKDIRRYIDVKESIKGKTTERRFVRQALHNLYRHFTSLQTFVDSIRAKSIHSTSQPLASDLVWLEHHVVYIDCLLFESLKGMWGLWNKPILDLLVMSFLEPTVRCSPRRQYPNKLEEKVRKWMKKNQIGMSSSYGVVPYFLHQAMLSDRRVVWSSSQGGYHGRGRPSPLFRDRGESRGRVSTSFSAPTRRSAPKPEGKGGQNE